MKCLVTGGAGFIGSHVADCLIDDGHEITIIDNLFGGYLENVNPKAKFVKKDLIDLDPNDVLLKGIDVVYHIAAFPAEGLSLFVPFQIFQKNLMSFLRLLAACINNDVKTIVFTSSMAVYGENQEYPFDESLPRNPTDPYGVSKAVSEQFLEIYSEEYGFNYVILRPHNVYGIRQNLNDPYRNVLGIWINRLLNAKQPVIYGDGEQTRAFSHVSDMARCTADSAFNEKCYGEIINIGGAEPYKINDACKFLMDAFGVDMEPQYYPDRPREVRHAYCTTEKSARLLGFNESKELKVGLKEMVEWAKTLPEQKFKYLDEKTYEITKKMPETWLKKTM